MKQGWEIKKITEVCEFKSGTTIDTKLEKSKGEVIYIKVGDMNLKGNETYITTSSRYVDLDKINNKQIIAIGSIIFPKRGGAIATNKKRRIMRPTIVDLNTMAMMPNKEIDKDYLFFWFSQIDLSSLSNGTSIPQINNYSFDGVYISFPKSLDEQKRIVSILDETFTNVSKVKDNAKQNLKNAKELFESYLQSIFTNKGDDWEEKMLKDIGVAQTGTTPKTADKKNYGDFIPFIKPADIDIKGDGEIRYDNDGLSEQGLSNGRKMLQGSILMVCIGATIGKVGFADREVSCNQQVNSLTVKKDYSPRFIYYALSTKGFFEQVIHNSAQATLPIINKGKWETLYVSFPKSKIEQDNFVEKFNLLQKETKRLEAIYEQKLNDLNELKKSILQKAFNGEL